ncbi:hypothetical protein ALC62_00885, partial [Cyphomyrmex costatus]
VDTITTVTSITTSGKEGLKLLADISSGEQAR